MVHGGELRNFQQRSPRPIVDLGEDLADDATGHELQQALIVGVRHVEGRHAFAVTQDRDAIAQAVDFAHAVGDVDDAHAAALRLLDHREQTLRFAIGKRGRRLVQDQHRQLGAKRLGDLDHLLLGAAEILNALSRPQRKAELLENTVGPSMELGLVEKAVLGQLRAEKQVLLDGQRRDQ